MNHPKPQDTIAILKSIPSDRLILIEPNHLSIANLRIGQVGTVLEVHTEAEETYCLIEFANPQEREYARAILKLDELLVLHYELATA